MSRLVALNVRVTPEMKAVLQESKCKRQIRNISVFVRKAISEKIAELEQ